MIVVVVPERLAKFMPPTAFDRDALLRRHIGLGERHGACQQAAAEEGAARA